MCDQKDLEAFPVLHQVPIGGEDLSRYSGSPRLARATGDDTGSALFILDALDPLTDSALSATADELLAHLHAAEDGLRFATRLIRSPPGAEH